MTWHYSFSRLYGAFANHGLRGDVNADLILPVLADEILPVYRPDSVEANGSDA